MLHLLRKKRHLLLAFIPWPAFMQQVGSWPDEVRVRIGSADCAQGKDFLARTAVTLEQKKKGLMGRRTPLASDEAMLFVAKDPGGASFWMKNTVIPLGILFFSPSGQLLSSREMKVEADPGNPVERYKESRAVGAVLEVAGGMTGSFEPNQSHLCVASKAAK